MKMPLVLLLWGSCFVAQSQQHIRNISYEMQVSIFPETKKLESKTTLLLIVDSNIQGGLKLLLHKDAQINSVKLNGRTQRFILQQSDKPSNRYMPESKDLLIFSSPLKKGRQVLEIDYSIVFNELKQNNSSFTNQWISLASYSSWYPVNFDWGDFIFRIRATLPPAYQLSGTGKLAHKNNTWTLTQSQPASDMVLIASNKLLTKKFSDGKVQVKLDYIDYSPAIADSILQGTAAAYRFFNEKFGPINKAALTIVATPAKGGSAFSRKDFFYMQTKGQTGFETYKTISHEVAHFWWNTGSSESWEDWLNESFAEFSTLLFVKTQLGDSVYRNILSKYKVATEGLPSIWGLNRSDNNASLVLYYKGSVLLSMFMNEVGEEAFFDLLKQMHLRKISTTAELLQLVAQQISTAAANRLEGLLKDQAQ